MRSKQEAGLSIEMRLSLITVFLGGSGSIFAAPVPGTARQNVQHLEARAGGNPFAAVVKAAMSKKGKVLPDTTVWVKNTKRPSDDTFEFPALKKPNIQTLKRPGVTIENWKTKAPKLNNRAVDVVV